MPNYSAQNSLDNGMAIIQSNRIETLLAVLQFWLQQFPLTPLENEVLLLNNNGMGQWLKQQLALNSGMGIVAGTDLKLPSAFIWQIYRQILGHEQIPKQQLLAKATLIWRLYRLLPQLLSQAGFEVLRLYLEHDQQNRKRYQLAEHLADLFDQYQVYRADWLADWSMGNDVIRDGHGFSQPLPSGQSWQALLWRAILADLDQAEAEFASRASVHQAFMARTEIPATKLPRRIIVFGLSSLPQQSLEVLAKLAEYTQIILFVHNPCQHYWADIIPDRELLKAVHKRQSYKPNNTTQLDLEQLHQHSNPLLAAWGKQGRDYLRLLDQFDQLSHYQSWQWPEQKTDLFADYGQAEQRSLLERIQQSILDLEDAQQSPELLEKVDNSLQFHLAHSAQREVEILHDQLLARFNAAANKQQALHPRDVIVMVPDINRYAPHIRAVFGLFTSDDPRHIPYSLADQQQRGQQPLLIGLETLLQLPDSRFAVSEVLALLEVPAIRSKFGLDAQAVTKLQQWIAESGIRWGLSSQQRQDLTAMPVELAANSWEFGLHRMLLGYAVGDGLSFNGIEPYPEIGGLDAQWLGGLASLIESLEYYYDLLKQDYAADSWHLHLLQLLEDFFLATNDSERKLIELVTKSLNNYLQNCQQANLQDEPLSLNVVKEAWLNLIDEPNLQQRFLSGKVNFCTLMPMRAIPFRLVCILGMNDGDYPRSYPAQNFDLMQQRGHYRPGDRSRRQDDQYLFLEALLSAREQLYISWVGNSCRDNSERPPSVLISQLRDFISQCWCLADAEPALIKQITFSHPLQAFSKKYLADQAESGLFTYAREWFADHEKTSFKPVNAINQHQAQQLSLEMLANFLKAPVKSYCNQTLKVFFSEDNLASEDDEPFTLAGLKRWQHSQQLLTELLNQPDQNQQRCLSQHFQRLQGQGALPLAGFAELSYQHLADTVIKAWQQYQLIQKAWPLALPVQAIALALPTTDSNPLQLTGQLTNLFQNSQHQIAQILLSTQSLLSKNGIQYQKLMLYWVQHLAGNAQRLTMKTYVVGPDSVLEFRPLTASEAQAELEQLAAYWQTGLKLALPIAIKTAFSWLSAKPEQNSQVAEKSYQGDEWSVGELDYDPYLKRFYPDFAALQNPEQPQAFEFWCEALYRSAFDSITLAGQG